MKYDVYAQGNFIKTVEADSTGQVLSIIGTEIQQGLIVLDNTKPHNIRIEPRNE